MARIKCMMRIARTWKWLFIATAAASVAPIACGLEEGGFAQSGGAGNDAGQPDAGSVSNHDSGADSGPGSCSPIQEKCNGVDDNCNGVTDEGCPTCDGDDGICHINLAFAATGGSGGSGGSGLLGFPRS